MIVKNGDGEDDEYEDRRSGRNPTPGALSPHFIEEEEEEREEKGRHPLK